MSQENRSGWHAGDANPNAKFDNTKRVKHSQPLYFGYIWDDLHQDLNVYDRVGHIFVSKQCPVV